LNAVLAEYPRRDFAVRLWNGDLRGIAEWPPANAKPALTEGHQDNAERLLLTAFE